MVPPVKCPSLFGIAPGQSAALLFTDSGRIHPPFQISWSSPWSRYHHYNALSIVLQALFYLSPLRLIISLKLVPAVDGVAVAVDDGVDVVGNIPVI